MSNSICPDCPPNRSPSLATYADGTYCYRCRKATHYKSLFADTKTMYTPGMQYFGGHPINGKVREWLNKYYITDNHIEKYNITYDGTYQLIFPRFCDNDTISCAWIRNFSSKSKWLYTYRDKDAELFLYTFDNQQEILYIVEDVVSGIRVSDYADCLVLGGTSCKKDKLIPIVSRYNKIILFLDGDNAGRTGAEKLRKLLKIYADILILDNRKDPKEFTPKELKVLIDDNRKILSKSTEFKRKSKQV